MPWSGGQFTRIHDWVDDKNAGIPITASRMDADSDDFTSGINNCLAKDGSNTPTANLNIGSFRLTSVGPGTALTDGANVSQVQAGVLNWGVAGGTADALTVTFSPAQVTIADGTIVCIRAASANATTAPTLAFNATTARTITRYGGAKVQAGDIAGALAEVILRYNSANTRWELLNPAKGYISLIGKSGAAVTAPVDTNENTLLTITIPANALGANGFLRGTFNLVVTNNANAKTLRIRYSGIAGSVMLSQSLASISTWNFAVMLSNLNSTSAQQVDTTLWNSFPTSGANLGAASAIDTTAATTLLVTVQKATAGDSIVLKNNLFELITDGT